MTFSIIQAFNNCTIINSSDILNKKSIYKALNLLKRQTKHAKKYIIISDLLIEKYNLYTLLNSECKNTEIDKVLVIGNGKTKSFKNPNINFWENVDTFIKGDNINKLENTHILLLTLENEHTFEPIVQNLQNQTQLTTLEINLDAIEDNLKYFRKLLNDETKIMVMVKAFSYGSGCYEIANFLEYKNVDYLGVAITDEGVKLRQSGIKLPIIVMNPNKFSFDRIIQYNLEPEIYSHKILLEFNKSVEKAGLKSYPIHIKIDTGMNRLGFNNENLDALISNIKKSKYLKPISVFSHLVGSSEPSLHDAFTLNQIKSFNLSYQKIQNLFDYKLMRHILNSGGIENYNYAQYEMVRLGIGLYGISSKNNIKLKNISTLKTNILQIRNVHRHSSIGYDRSAFVNHDSRIAVIPIGYADGYNRLFGNGLGKVFINGKFAPVIGNICMDTCMIDVSNIEASEGDEVIIFGNEIPISQLARQIGTIPYEILSSVPERIKHVYHTTMRD